MGLAIWASKIQPDKWVLLIDGDMHVRTVELKMCPMADVTLAQVLQEGKPLEEAVYLCELESNGKPLYPRLAVLPAGGRFLPPMRGNPLDFINQTKRQFDEMVEKLRRRFALIIVDTPASMSFEHLILTAIADAVIYVAEPNDDSIESTKLTAEGLKEFMDVQPLGVVLNRVPSSVDERKWVEKASQISKVIGVIPDDEMVGEAFRQNLPVVAVDPSSPASRAVEKIARKLFEAKVKPTKLPKKIERAMEKTVIAAVSEKK